MSDVSIFEGVVRSENSHTNLLRNLMCLDRDYCQAICQLLQPDGLNFDFTVTPKVRTQVSLIIPPDNRHGQADMLIETQAETLLVEVKTDWYCELTDKQNFEIDRSGNPSPNGYIAYLEARKRKGDKVGLCVLAPLGWRYRRSTESMLQALARMKFGAHLTTWEQVSSVTSRGNFGGFVKEFASFLEGNFMNLRFDPNEESVLISPDGLSRFGSTLLKLQELIRRSTKELRSELNSKGEVRWEIKDLWGDSAEYGAAVYRGSQRVLWFGTWAKADWPLVLGADKNYDQQGLHFGSLEPLPELIEGWKAYKLPKNCFTGDDSLVNLVSTLVGVLGVQP